MNLSSLQVPDDLQSKAWFFWQKTNPRRDFVKPPDSIVMTMCKCADQFGFDQTTCFTFDYSIYVCCDCLSLDHAARQRRGCGGHLIRIFRNVACESAVLEENYGKRFPSIKECFILSRIQSGKEILCCLFLILHGVGDQVKFRTYLFFHIIWT